MTITKFREINKNNAIPLPLSEIRLTEPCHQKAERKNAKISAISTEPMCIVRKIEDGTYALIIGYRDYITAKNNGAAEVKAIVVPDISRRAFIKSLANTFEIWNTADVRDPDGWTPPSGAKVHTCQQMYENTGTFGKRIILSPTGVVLDGYAAVYAARLLGVEKIPVYIYPMYYRKKKKKKFSKTS